MFDSDSYFWNDVSGDHEASRKTASLVHGKVASATWWPFLSHAVNETDFDNRLSVVAGRIEAAVEPDVYDDVISSLRDDFRAVHEASRNDGGMTSPELAEFNAGMASRTADLSEMEWFNPVTGKWTHTSAAEMKKDDPDEDTEDESEWEKHKFKKKEAKGPENYSHGDSPCCDAPGHRPGRSGDFSCQNCGNTFSDKSLAVGTKSPNGREKRATNYQPDPNAAWRYHYPNLNGPVNNGSLQDSDGFVQDLAADEHRDEERMQFQVTPGQWHDTPGTAMPERPMPMDYSNQLGYRPVASFVDADGFLVEASDVAQEGVAGRANSPLVDPAVGTPLRVNPYYFNTEDAAMGSNEGFPQQPQPDPMDRINEIYGEGGSPVQSAGSTEGTVDGKGYSRSNPGEAPDFSRKMSLHSSDPRDDRPTKAEAERDAWENNDHPHGPHKQVDPDNDPWGDAWNKATKSAATDGKIVGQCPGCDKPLRAHSTAHGTELHHLHNDHVRCFGPKTADVMPGSAVGNDMDKMDDPEDSATPMDDPMSATGSAQFFDPTLTYTADYLGRPDANNPTGRGPDEFRAERWDAYRSTRPMQEASDRKINTPVMPADPLRTPQHSTPTPGLRGGPNDRPEEDDDDDDE